MNLYILVQRLQTQATHVNTLTIVARQLQKLLYCEHGQTIAGYIVAPAQWNQSTIFVAGPKGYYNTSRTYYYNHQHMFERFFDSSDTLCTCCAAPDRICLNIMIDWPDQTCYSYVSWLRRSVMLTYPTAMLETQTLQAFMFRHGPQIRESS